MQAKALARYLQKTERNRRPRRKPSILRRPPWRATPDLGSRLSEGSERMKVWAIANQKGGVGKTTTTIALAGLLADAGQRVLVIDLDPHGSMTSYFGHDPDTLELSVFDLFSHPGKLPEGLARGLLLATSHERIALLPASTALATLERRSPGKGGLGL